MMRANLVMDHSKDKCRKKKTKQKVKIINLCLRMNIKLNLEETRPEEDKDELRREMIVPL